MHTLEVENSNITEKRESIENFVNQNIRGNFQSINVTIPIVFHVLHHRDEQNITEEQILSQLFILNEIFDKKGPVVSDNSYELQQYQRKTSPLNIRFCLARNDGLSDGAIIRKDVDHKSWQMGNEMKASSTGGSDPIDTEHYLNIWIVNLSDYLSGYAQMPGGPIDSDGIVIDYRFIGNQGTVSNPYNQGKTLVHLIGNYLGLYSLWGDGHCVDDYVSDTPIHNSVNYVCGEGAHISLCDGNKIEMTRNFMDNTPDDCMSYFTIGQKTRILTMLSNGGPRYMLQMGQSLCDQQPLISNSTSNKN